MQRAHIEFPAPLAAVATATEARVEALLASELARWESVDPMLRAPLEALQQLVQSGGKRLRPAFCAVAFFGAGGGAIDDIRVIEAGAALELLHTFALVHDDVMDGSDTRRGLPSVHQRFIEEHREESLRGEARRFGEGTAILIGDVAFVLADRLVCSAPSQVVALWHEVRLELCIGQFLDLAGAARRRTDLTLANRIANFKSAKYTVERPLQIGAALAGRVDEFAVPLSDIGRPLGMAFQLRDDLLGVFGDALVTGKPVGDDLREGKPTPLLAAATERADRAGQTLLERVGAPDLTAEEIKELQELLDATGARAAIEAEIDRLVQQSHAAIATAPLRAEAQQLLRDLATYVAWRDR